LNEIKYHPVNPNPDIEISLANHLISLEILDPTFEEYYDVFFDDRANLIYKLIQVYLVNKQEQILQLFFKEQEIKQSGNIKVFASYIGIDFDAVYSFENQKILYKGIEYSPSGAAKKCKEEHSGKSDISANGWDFWKFRDSGNVIK